MDKENTANYVVALYGNASMVEVINQMPNYAKFLKEILNKKRKIDEEGIVNLTTTYSAII